MQLAHERPPKSLLKRPIKNEAGADWLRLDHFLRLPRFAFALAALAVAPEAPGVYALFDGADLIYVGATGTESSRTIHEALMRRYQVESASGAARATHYTWDITLSSASCEAELLEQFEARHHSLPRDQASAGQRLQLSSAVSGGGAVVASITLG